MRFVIPIVLLTAACAWIAAATTTTITPEQASNFSGRQVTVVGTVVQVARIPSGMVFLNFGDRHPRSVFTAVVRPGTQGFEDVERFEGREVEISGTISMHRDHPQIVLQSATQLRAKGEPGSRETGTPASGTSLAVAPALPEPLAPVAISDQSPEATSPASPGTTPNAKSTPSESAAALQPGGVLAGARPGMVHEFTVPLTPAQQKEAGRGPDGKFPAAATVGIVLPDGFDPAGPHNVLAVFATDDGGGAHVRALGRIGRIAAEKGWIAVAANGPVLDKTVSPEWHNVMILAALEAISKEIPGFAKWPLYTGGNSGGASRASMIACGLLAGGHNVRGVFMGSSGGERFRVGSKIFRPPAAGVRALRVFLAYGKNDPMLREGDKNEMESALKAAGIRTVRRVDSDGGHGLESEVLSQGLDWLSGSGR
jgi:hypothetical protein